MKKLFKTLAVCLMVCLLVVPFAACGRKKKTPAEYWRNDPKAVKISTYDEYKTFVEEYNDCVEPDLDEFNDAGKYVVFTQDIDCNGEVLTPWLTADACGLKYTIEGAGHALKNFKIDQSCIEVPPAADGTVGTFVFTTLSLFPIVHGATIKNIEFKDFEIKADLTQVDGAKGDYDIYVGLFGYVRSSRVGGDQEVGEQYKTTTFKNVKVTNEKIDITCGQTTNGSNGFSFAIGGLIGLDSDNTNVGAALNDVEGTKCRVGVRENVTVSNLDIKLNKTAGGTALIGGLVGQTHWMRAEYKNCNVDGKVNVTTTGKTWGDTTYDPSVDQWQAHENAKLNDTIQIGGLIGCELKWNHEIKIIGGSTKLDVTATIPSDVEGHTPREYIHIGNAVGLYANGDLIPDDADVTGSNRISNYHTVTVDETFDGACTLVVNGGQKENILADVVKTTELLATAD